MLVVGRKLCLRGGPAVNEGWVLQMSDVVKSYPGESGVVLRIPKLELEAGQHLALRGRSGICKSPLLN